MDYKKEWDVLWNNSARQLRRFQTRLPIFSEHFERRSWMRQPDRNWLGPLGLNGPGVALVGPIERLPVNRGECGFLPRLAT